MDSMWISYGFYIDSIRKSIQKRYIDFHIDFRMESIWKPVSNDICLTESTWKFIRKAIRKSVHNASKLFFVVIHMENYIEFHIEIRPKCYIRYTEIYMEIHMVMYTKLYGNLYRNPYGCCVCECNIEEI